jgi:excisionase family DNA binding protein
LEIETIILRMMESTELLTEREVAALLRVAPSTVGRWAATGLIPVIVLPSGRRRFRRDDVTLLLESTVSGVRVGDAVVNL